jgi:hypothetical protein
MDSGIYVIGEPFPTEYRSRSDQENSEEARGSIGWDATDVAHGGCSTTMRTTPNGDKILFFAYMLPVSEIGYYPPIPQKVSDSIGPRVDNLRSRNISACQNPTEYRPTGFHPYSLVAGHLNATANNWCWTVFEFTHTVAEGSCCTAAFGMKGEGLLAHMESGYFGLAHDMGNGFKFDIWGGDCDVEYGYHFKFTDFRSA